MSQRVRTPVVAPDGKHFAAFLGMGREQGLWLLPTGAGDAEKLIDGLAWPLVWLDEEAIVFVRDPFGGSGNTRIEMTFTAGGATLNVSGGSPGTPGYEGDSGTAGTSGQVNTTAKDDAVGIPTPSGQNIVPLLQMLLLN